MYSTRHVATSTTALVTLSFLALGPAVGCKKGDKEGADAAPTASATASASAPVASATASATAKPPLPMGPPADPFKLVDAPSAKDVTKGPVVGSANGHKFEAKAIVVEAGYNGWEMTITDTAPTSPTGYVSGTEYIKITFSKDELALKSKKFSKPMKYGDGFFQIIRTTDPSGTTSWNADNAYYIEFTSWDVKPFDPNARGSQVAGKASGKVYVVYKATSADFKNSGASGEFKDIPVRYSSSPFWTKKK
ncbi:MAG: hypothetical protein U0174_23020 [Polyangiaceae bacterium]